MGSIDMRTPLHLFTVASFVVAAVALAPALGAGQDERVIRVIATAVSGKTQENPPAGPAGDVFTGSDRLRNAVAQFGKPKGAIVGRDTYRLVFRSASIATVSVTARLPGGSIKCRGKFYGNRRSQLIRVVDGTGTFAGATGTCAASPSGTDTLNTYRLR
jgi:hypothetical protein